jgi:hypothetical protein
LDVLFFLAAEGATRDVWAEGTLHILKENQVLLSLANQFVKMLVFNRLHRA